MATGNTKLRCRFFQLDDIDRFLDLDVIDRARWSGIRGNF